MNKNCFISFLIIFLLLSLSLNIYLFFSFKTYLIPQSQSSLKEIYVTKVIDGDTFDSRDKRYRLYELDAPEYPNGCLGENAKLRLKELIEQKTIKIEKIDIDNFGRDLVYVYLNDIFINQVMIEEGLATFRKGKIASNKTFLLESSQLKAKNLNRGIFSSLCQTKKPECVIKGNYRKADSTKIYHTPDCYNYDKITIRPNTLDRWFCTEEEAQKSGFVKSKDCPK
jgi:endonuclease YncB( thermonuclease family)